MVRTQRQGLVNVLVPFLGGLARQGEHEVDIVFRMIAYFCRWNHFLRTRVSFGGRLKLESIWRSRWKWK